MVGQFVKDTYSYDVGGWTISDILKQCDKWMAYDECNKTEQKSTRITQTKHAELKDALFLWHANALTHNVAISDEILLTKAEQLGKELGVTDLSYSINPLIIITSVTDFVTIETLFQGQKVGFSNPTVLQSDSNFHFTNRVGLSRLDCTFRNNKEDFESDLRSFSDNAAGCENIEV